MKNRPRWGTVAKLGVVSLAAMSLTVSIRVAGNADTHAEVCEISDKLVNSCRPWLGASANKYPQVGSGLRSQTEYHEQRIGRQLDIVHAYNAATATGLSPDERHFATRPNTTLFLNWKPAAQWSDGGGANAAVNNRIDVNAESIKSLGDTKIFLTLHHEPENDVSGGMTDCTIRPPGNDGTTDEYRAMWANVRARFDALGVTNVVWAVNYMSYQPYNCMINDLYPGNNLVDWIFFDNYGSGTQDSFEENVGRMYNLLTTRSDAAHDYNSKPWGIAEWNIRKGKVTPQQTYDYYGEAAALLEQNFFPKLKAYVVYDSIGPDGNENRIMYQPGGVLDPLRQEHYAAFAQSGPFNVTVPPEPDMTPPASPVIENLTVNNAGARVGWLAATDDVGVAYYEVYRGGQLIGSTTETTFLDTTVQDNSVYEYAVRAVDTSQNTSELSIAVSIAVGDITAPTAPGNPGGVVNADDSVTLTWETSTDNTGVEVYEVWRGTSFLADSPTTSFTDFTTAQGRTYTYRVYATDEAGNRSDASPTATVVVPDKVAPTPPGSLRATSPALRRVRLTWTAGNDNVGVSGYYVYRDSVRFATVARTAASSTINGLVSGRTYRFMMRAFDAAGNISADSNSVSIRVR